MTLAPKGMRVAGNELPVARSHGVSPSPLGLLALQLVQKVVAAYDQKHGGAPACNKHADVPPMII
jgi:hypothetical protein